MTQQGRKETMVFGKSGQNLPETLQTEYDLERYVNDVPYPLSTKNFDRRLKFREMPAIREQTAVSTSSSPVIDAKKQSPKLHNNQPKNPVVNLRVYPKSKSSRTTGAEQEAAAASYMRLEEPLTPGYKASCFSPYLKPMKPSSRKTSASPEEGGIVHANANFCTLPLSVNQ